MTDALTYVEHEVLSLKSDPTFNEAWLHDRIRDNPSILGLGDVDVLDHERRHTGAGRLDLLLYDDALNRRYEVEVMLGATDPSHIIRTIEYWDIERRRYPGYDHVAVLIAEDITSRFLNVMSLLSGSIPFIAIQLSALRVGNQIVLNFVRVLDQTDLRIDDTVEEAGGSQVDRAYWDGQVGGPLMHLCDQILGRVNAVTSKKYEMNFLEQYIGLRSNGVVNNFIWFGPKKKKGVVNLGFRTALAPEIHSRFEQAALSSKLEGQRYVKVAVNEEVLAAHQDLITQAIQETVKDNDA